MDIKGQFEGEIDVKRFYLPGLTLSEKCPRCGTLWDFDGESEYISNPVIGKPETIHCYCQNCEFEWSRMVLLTIIIKAVP